MQSKSRKEEKNLSKNILFDEILKKPENLIKAIIGFLIVAFAVFTFFADFWMSPEAVQRLKDKAPSQILFVLGTIVLVELWERVGLHSILGERLKSLETEHLESIEESLNTIQPAIKNIEELGNLVHIIEGEDNDPTEYQSGLEGQWISLFQYQNRKTKRVEWTSEIIKISDLGNLLYIETIKSIKPMKGFGRIIQNNVFLGHWVATYDKTGRQGDFLLQKNAYDDLIYGIYNNPKNPDDNYFYKWMFIKYNENQTTKDMQIFCEEIWKYLKPLEGKFLDTLEHENIDFANLKDKISDMIFKQLLNKNLEEKDAKKII